MKHYLTLFFILLVFTGNTSASFTDQGSFASGVVCADADDTDKDESSEPSEDEDDEPDCE